MPRKELSRAQRLHLDRLMVTIKNAEADAQRFLGYCAAEHEVELGRDGWTFDLDEMTFKQDEPDSGEDAFSPSVVLTSLSGNGDRHA